jgi:hypothetical protein
MKMPKAEIESLGSSPGGLLSRCGLDHSMLEQSIIESLTVSFLSATHEALQVAASPEQS